MPTQPTARPPAKAGRIYVGTPTAASVTAENKRLREALEGARLAAQLCYEEFSAAGSPGIAKKFHNIIVECDYAALHPAK